MNEYTIQRHIPEHFILIIKKRSKKQQKSKLLFVNLCQHFTWSFIREQADEEWGATEGKACKKAKRY